MEKVNNLSLFLDKYFHFSSDMRFSLEEHIAIKLHNLLIGIINIFLGILSIVALVVKVPHMAIINVCWVTLFTGNYFIFYFKKNFSITSHITVTLFSMLFLYLIITGGPLGTGLVWCLLFPFIALHCLGYKIGSIFALLQFILYMIVLFGFSNQSWIYDYSKSFSRPSLLIIKVAIVYCCIYLIAYATAKAKHDLVKRLEENNRAKHNFFINLAHETKTPLTLVHNALSDFMEHHKSSEPLMIIERSLLKIERDMLNYLDIQKLQNDQVYYNHNQVTDLTMMIKEKAKLVRPYLDRKNLTLELKLDEDHTYAFLDPEAFDRIFNNLLDNAVKYNNEGGTITIMLRPTDENIEFIVVDTGQGMPEEEREHLFDSYYQMSHQKRNTQGLGMGLSIVKGIVDDAGGSIEVYSTLFKGSTFIIRLKRARESSAVNSSTLDDFEITSPYNPSSFDDMILTDSEYDENLKTILIVEDNTMLLSYLIDKLKDSYNVYYAVNGQDALFKLKTLTNVDVIISDIMMDTIDGYEFKETLNASDTYKDIPFIFLTAKTSDSEKLTGLSLGAVDFISKPFSLEALLYKIQSIIKISKAVSDTQINKLTTVLSDYLGDTITIGGPDEDVANDESLSYDDAIEHFKITPREVKVASMLMEGLLYKEIAYELNISINTVRTHVRRLYKKLDINSTKELYTIFEKYKLLE